MRAGTVPAFRQGRIASTASEASMPELPEVELTKRHLDAVMSGRVLSRVEVRHVRTARHNASPEEVVARLEGRRVTSVRRHGKFLRLDLDDGQTMVTHLGMSGRWSIDPEEVAPHTHFEALLDDGSRVHFVDPRTFGFVAVFEPDELGDTGLGRLGRDAWVDAPDPEDLARSLHGRTAPIKALLLDQTLVAGLGNIYADEVLFGAGIHPLTPAGSLGVGDCRRLLDVTRMVLDKAIEHGGTTLDDLAYLIPDGRAGENMAALSVYGRDGEPCDTCGTPIEKVVVRARSSHFCPVCQPPP